MVCESMVIKPLSIWVCLKMGYTPNYSHLIGIMISKTIGFRGTLFSDKPIWDAWILQALLAHRLTASVPSKPSTNCGTRLFSLIWKAIWLKALPNGGVVEEGGLTMLLPRYGYGMIWTDMDINQGGKQNSCTLRRQYSKHLCEWPVGTPPEAIELGPGRGKLGIQKWLKFVTLWWTYKKQLKMAIEIVEFPMKNGDFPLLC